MNGRAVKWLVVAGLLVALAPAWAADLPFRRMVIFGDSLSDPGNAFVLTGGTLSVPPYVAYIQPQVFSIAPYAKGGHHYSNGPTWVEQLARLLKMPASAKAAFQEASPLHANYAVGGSTAWDSNLPEVIPQQTLSGQVEEFLTDVDYIIPGDALYVIEFGGNDVRDALALGMAGGDPAELLSQSIQNIASRIVQLHALGARQFLVTYSPDLGLTPAVKMLNSPAVDASGAASYLSFQFNVSLAAAVASLKNLDGITIHEFSFASALDDLLAHQEELGLTNVSDPCITPESAPYTCGEPDHYLFWDGLHPTKRVHGLVAEQAAALLTAP